MKLKSFKNTIAACYVGNITQAIINNFAPLLFLTFSNTFQISYVNISFLIIMNFGIQFLMDALASKFVDKIGYRPTVITAHLLCAIGLTLLGILPNALNNHFLGIIICVAIYGMGGGIIEVIISPIVEACPTEEKASNMAILHSMYCWGQLLVVLASTFFFYFVGIDRWRILTMLWAIVPFLNMIYFCFVPINKLTTKETQEPIKSILKSKIVWILLLLMVCAGAAELSTAQWASALIEADLNVSKTTGDLLGTCMFALLMGISRVVYSFAVKKISIEKLLLFSSILCIFTFVLSAIFQNNTIISLIAIGLRGFSVGAMWPGVYSIGMKKMKHGGTALFAIMAFAGDFGCMSGPTLVGVLAGAIGTSLNKGMLAACIFPLIMLIGCIVLILSKKSDNIEKE